MIKRTFVIFTADKSINYNYIGKSYSIEKAHIITFFFKYKTRFKTLIIEL